MRQNPPQPIPTVTISCPGRSITPAPRPSNMGQNGVNSRSASASPTVRVANESISVISSLAFRQASPRSAMGFDDSDFNDRFNDLIVPYKTGSVPLCFSNELNYHSPAGLSYSSSLPISEQAASDLYLWGQTLRNAGYTQRVIPKLKINPLVWILPKVQNFVQQARRVQNPFRGPLLTLNARAFKVGIARTNERQLPGICERISDTHIGTIIVTVPSHFTGGALNVAGSSNVLESSPGEQDKYFWAFVPCNMAYDFELVSSGYQIVLYCDVWLEGPNDAMTTPPNAPFQLMTQ